MSCGRSYGSYSNWLKKIWTSTLDWYEFINKAENMKVLSVELNFDDLDKWIIVPSF